MNTLNKLSNYVWQAREHFVDMLSESSLIQRVTSTEFRRTRLGFGTMLFAPINACVVAVFFPSYEAPLFLLSVTTLALGKCIFDAGIRHISRPDPRIQLVYQQHHQEDIKNENPNIFY